ncbi:MAG: SusC/RagA family TonB-linked outer membrane protein [Dysgonamonadaceae bacterium]|nr:SusC/RagA family TonB-linked outer membrane protein [Dysgonamonadaceae bacterium]
MKKIAALFLLFIGCLSIGDAYSQGIKGTVVDEQGEPLIGASVKVVDGKEKTGNLSLGTVTNINGEYSLQVPNTNFSLEFSYIGYETTTIPLSNTEALKRVVLRESSAELSEVVITGMQRVDKRLFTGAAAHLSQGDVKIDGIAEVGRSLEGRVAGVSVQNVSGTFGTAPKIRVRGATSIYGDSSPLWVVDGVVIQNVVDVSADELSSGDAETVLSSAVAGLNASDIESWDILKDGTASSIYGARAKAGVIVITTKKGKKNTSSINYRGEYTTRLIPSYADFNIMNSQDQMAVYQEMQAKGWLNFSNTYRRSSSGVYGKMYQLLNTYDPVTGIFALQQTEEAMNGYLREAERRNTDWFQELFNTSLIQNHSVSMSGGTEKSTYYGSVSALLDPGWFKKSDNKRYTANLQLNHKLSNTLNFDILSRASYRSQSGPGTMGRTTNAVFGEVSRNFDINPYSYALNSSRTLDPNEIYTRNYADFNIKNELDANYMDYNLVDLTFQGKLTWNVLKGWDVEVLGATAYSTAATEHHVTDASNQALAYRAMQDANVRDNNPYLYKDPDDLYALPITILPYGGIFERSDNKSISYNFRATSSYVTALEDTHILGFFGGMEITNAEKERTWFRGWGRQYSMGDVPFYDYKMFKHGQEAGLDYYSATISRERTAAFFAKADYSYKGKYILNVTGRYDGSNRMGKSRKARWTPTWNVGLAWNLHEEDFFKSLAPVLTHAKINPSYSLTADRPSVTNALAIIRATNAWRPDVASQEPSLYISSLENSELTYEKKHEYNIGMELGFLNNRISLLADVFKRYNFDLIGRLDVMGIGGEVQKYANVAAMSGSGFEATLTTKNIVKKDFRWTSSFIFSNIQVKVEELKNERRVIDLITGNGFGMVGYPDRALFSIPFAGLDEDGLPTFINEKNEVSYLVNNQERINLDFLKYEGPSNPTITGSFGNIFNYKNFRLNIYVTYSAGNKLRLDPYFSYTYTDYSAMPKEFKNRWILPGDELQTNIPTIPTRRQVNAINNLRYAYNSYNYSDVRVADGGFIRLKEISLAYDFPKTITSALRVRDLQAKLQGTNLFLLYADPKLNGQDPEFFNSGGVAAPMAKQITFTLSVGL